MFGRPEAADSDDQSVALVEALLEQVTTRAIELGSAGGTRSPANRAVLICACVTSGRAPNWLIYDDPAGALRWSRIADGSEVSDVVDARLSAEGHADPGGVLAWLRGDEVDPWFGGDGWGDGAAVRDLGRKIRTARDG